MPSLQQPTPGSGREPPPVILIVEDTLDGRQTLQTLLAGQGYMLAFAENGLEGLAKAAELVPDLILLDVMLPGIDGLEVCRRLRANQLLAEVPVIMITALDDRETRLQGIIAGADDFISKRLDGTELRARVRTITRLNRYRRLVRERAKFERLVELMPNGLLLVDAEGTISLANPAMRSILEAGQHDIIVGKDLRHWIDPEQRDQCAAALRQAVALVTYSAQFETICLRMNGSAFPAEIEIGHFVWDDQALAYVVIRDISNRRQLEEQLLQSQKMESVGRLAGGIAHDFNNLLTAIMGHAELSLDTLAPEAREREDLHAIFASARSAANLIRQLLTFARRQTIEPRTFNPNDLLLDIDRLLRRLIGEDIELVTFPAPDLGLIRADPNQIEQVLVNLAVNARDAMPDGGKLTIETANVELDAAYAHAHVGVEPGQYVMLAVSDTGVGIDESIRPYIFEPFFTTKPLGQGTGLGLATCYGIVKQHGGTMEVYSTPRDGAAFKVYLPRVEGLDDSTRRSEPAATMMPSGSETILLVEDEAGVRELVARILVNLGYTVLEAHDGEDALRVAQEREDVPIDLLLTDMVLPRLGGKPLAERMTARYPGIKVLFISGYGEGGVVSSGSIVPSVAFLPKPFTASALARTVREMLEER
jgi:PAS domain S-box-containing protein